MSNCPIYDDPEECPEHGPGCIDDCPPLQRLDQSCGDPACTLCGEPFGKSSYKEGGAKATPPPQRSIRFDEIKRELAELNQLRLDHPEHADLVYHKVNALLEELENSTD